MIEVDAIYRGDDEEGDLIYTIKAESDAEPGHWYKRGYTDPLIFLYEIMAHLGNMDIRLEIKKPEKESE